MSFKDQKLLDLEVFTNPNEFGQVAILSVGGIDQPINIVIREVPSDLQGIEGMQTVFSLKRSDAPFLNKDALFILEGVKYRIINFPDDYSEVDYPKLYVTKV